MDRSAFGSLSDNDDIEGAGLFMISNLSPSLRGAKRRSNPDHLGRKILDCFASLAMTTTQASEISGHDRGDVDPAPLFPALQRAFGKLHALDAFEQRELVGRILVDVADEHLPLLLEAVVVADVVRQLLPIAIEIVQPLLVRIPHRP